MKYTKPPLSFMGNKKNQLKNIDEVLTNMQYAGYINEKTIFYDVFGGSGFISHFIKQKFKNNRVIWNDFDDYQSRLNMLENTEQVRKLCCEVVNFKDKQGLLSEVEKEKIRDILDEYDELDCITLSTYFLFCGNYIKDKETLKRKIKYKRLSLSPLRKEGYLEGVERVSMDFEKLILSIPKEKILNKEAFLILDPPYLQTMIGNYAQHFTLKQFLRLVELIFKPFLLFSNKKSDILSFIEFIKKYKDEVFGELCFNSAFSNIGSEDYIIYSCKRKGLFEAL